MLWDGCYFSQALSSLWFVPSGYQVQFFNLNSLYIFLRVVPVTTFFVVLSFLSFLSYNLAGDGTCRRGEKVLLDHWLKPWVW